MGWDEWQGILRAVVPALLSYLVGAGYLPGDQVAPLSAALVTIGACVWSVAHKKQLKA